ncbi:Promotilin [Manis pentadactyla]|nr:Promotilin [Manis pentadactyla]
MANAVNTAPSKSSKMVSRKAVAALLVVHVATTLASQTEAFVPFFTYSELQRMQEKEQNRGQKKSLSVQERPEEVDPLNPVEPQEGERVIKGSLLILQSQVSATSRARPPVRIGLTAPVEIGMRMNSRQLEKYRSALGGLLNEVLLSTQNETK